MSTGDVLGGPINLVIPVSDASQVGEARRAARTIGELARLSADEQGQLGIIVTEAATNLARHARDGMIFLRTVGNNGNSGAEMIAVDRGPGIRDLGRAMADGYSTAGTPGKGLGAIRRIAGQFDVLSAETGTTMVARIWGARTGFPHGAPGLEGDAGVICVAVKGETACGDAWCIQRSPESTLAAVVDGLGHGIEAATAASTAIRLILERTHDVPSALILAAHAALRGTRGAAIAVARIDHTAGIVRFAGVGNISAAICSPVQTRNMASYNGIAGHQITKVQQFEYPWNDASYLVMHSDGLSNRWRIDAYAGLLAADPALVAALLFRDFARPRDDVTVLALRDVQQRSDHRLHA